MISVIISVYNAEEFIKKSMESIVYQNYKDYEVVLINDASTDGTDLILSSLEKIHNNIIFFSNDKNLGLPKSLNLALNLSRFKYICRMDADDICEPSRLKAQLKYMLANPEIDILGSNAYLIDMNSNVVGQSDVPLDHHSIVKSLKYRNPMIHPSIMMKRKVLEKLGGYDESLRKAQDLDLWHRAEKAGFIFANLPECLIHYRIDLDKPTKTILKGFGVSFRHAVRNNSLKGMAFSIIDLVKYFFIKFKIYTPRSTRGSS